MADPFDRRYLLARYPTGGVVLDLESGNYYRVNESAALVCEAIRSGGDVEARIAASLRVSPEEAKQWVAAVSSELTGPTIHHAPQGPYHFQPSERGYVLVHGDRTVLEIGGPDLEIGLPPNAQVPSRTQLELYVRALVPKLLFQRGFAVLHASACEIGGRLLAFAGLSGAGKTTTVRAFAAAGATVISEDLVVLSPEASPKVFVAAEGEVHQWANRLAEQLAAHPTKAVRTGALGDFPDSGTAPLDQILILDRSERRGTDFQAVRLSPPDALISLLPHDFLGAIETLRWRDFFSRAVALVSSVELRRASAPDGLDVLAAAAARYISRMAS